MHQLDDLIVHVLRDNQHSYRHFGLYIIQVSEVMDDFRWLGGGWGENKGIVKGMRSGGIDIDTDTDKQPGPLSNVHS